MMIVKERQMPNELVMLELLSRRKKLSSEEFKRYQNLSRGFEGELQFDSIVRNYGNNLTVINDLRLKNNNKNFQIDSTVITNDTIYLFEIKNFLGQYYFDNEILFKLPNIEIENPIYQRDRATSLFRRYLHLKGFDITIKSYIVFIHPECIVYQTPLSQKILFHANIRTLISRLNENSHSSKNGQNVVNTLLASHSQELPVSTTYTFDELEKGIPCCQCGSMSTYVEGRIIICNECHVYEKADASIIRNIEAFHLLFPNEKLTTKGIAEWCGKGISEDRCKRQLLKHFVKQGVTSNTYFTNKKEVK
ncbi:nuclease-related domain-containing protein [Gracilibacillus salinarum]|uniref:NERD domain-containing protein n=1 Tax=Gracilibacillus salinarum TaxID=2932255 RepID=A0ABY4GHL7_9BACI|nr:nuclease-related domain-containing protein [Gracilibacillus salinarum]UOQ83654.1 NERD domain-containing protein [Gracilibacillus salinarum]